MSDHDTFEMQYQQSCAQCGAWLTTKAAWSSHSCHAAAKAHRTAIDLVLAHLAQAKELWHGMPASPEAVISMLVYNLKAMRDWTPEHAAEVLAEAMTDRARR